MSAPVAPMPEVSPLFERARSVIDDGLAATARINALTQFHTALAEVRHSLGRPMSVAVVRRLASSRGSGAINRINITIGTVKWRMLMDMRPSMQNARNTVRHTQIARQWNTCPLGMARRCVGTRCFRPTWASHKTKSSSARNPMGVFRTNTTG